MNTEGKENNLMGRNSPTADLQLHTKHTPGIVEKAAGRRREEKLLSSPWPQNTPEPHEKSNLQSLTRVHTKPATILHPRRVTLIFTVLDALS